MSTSQEYSCPSCEDTFGSKRGVSGHHVRAHEESIAKQEAECQNCGEVDEIYPSRREHGERYFCSKDCRADFYADDFKDRVEVECESCGSEYEVVRSRAEDGRNFCETKCLGEWLSGKTGEDSPHYNQVTVECDWCSDTFDRAPSNLKSEHTFCSMDCRDDWYSEYISGENHPRWIEDSTREYGPHWQRQRESAIQRDFEKCRICGMAREEHYERFGRDLEVHHQTPRRWFDELATADELTNLITLCKPHHMTVEHQEFGGDRE